MVGVPDFPKQRPMAFLKDVEQQLLLLIVQRQRDVSYAHNAPHYIVTCGRSLIWINAFAVSVLGSEPLTVFLWRFHKCVNPVGAIFLLHGFLVSQYSVINRPVV